MRACTHTYTHPISPSSVRSFCPAITLPPVLTSFVPHHPFLVPDICPSCRTSCFVLSVFIMTLLIFSFPASYVRQIQKHTINCWFRNPPGSHDKRQQVQIITGASADSPRLCSCERNQVTWQSCKFYSMQNHTQKQTHKHAGAHAENQSSPS